LEKKEEGGRGTMRGEQNRSKNVKGGQRHKNFGEGKRT